MFKRYRSLLALFPTAIIWGFAFVAQVLGSDHIGAFAFNGIRYLLGAASLCPLLLFLEKERDLSVEWRRFRHRYTHRISLLAGAAMFAASTFQQIGTMMTRDPAKAGFITGLYTVFTPVLYFIVFRKRVGVNTWIGCLLATVGLYLLCLRNGEGGGFGLGEVFLLLGSVFWAVHILIIDRFIDDVSPLRFSVWQFTACGLMSSAVAAVLALTGLEPLSWTGIWSARWALLYCGILSVGVAYTLQIFGQRDADPTHAAIIFSTESVFAAIGGILWNRITPAYLHVTQEILPIGYVGAVIIFIGIVISQTRFRRRHKPPQAGEDTL